MFDALPLLSTGLTEVQLLASGFAIGLAIVILGYLVWETVNAPPG